MFDVLANPFILMALLIPVVGGTFFIVGAKIASPKGTTVLQLSPETHSAKQFKAREDDSSNIRCDPIDKSPPQLFIKGKNSGWNVLTRGFMKVKNYALWIGMVGSAHVVQLDEAKQEVKVTLKDAVINVFGEENYYKLSTVHRDKIETNKLGVIVDLPLISKKEEGVELTSDDVHTSQFKQLIRAYTEGVGNLLKEGGGGGLSRIIFQVGTGVAIGIIVAFVFGIGKTEVIKV